MSSSSDDEDAFENFMFRLKSDRKTATGFVLDEAAEVKTTKTSMLEYRIPKFSSGSSSGDDKFEDALEEIENVKPKSPPPPRQQQYKDSSSEDDEAAFENLVSSLKTGRVGVAKTESDSKRHIKRAKSMDSFIVDDDAVDELEETWTSGSGEEDEEEQEESEQTSGSNESSPSDARRLFFQLQLEDERRLERKIICKTSPKATPLLRKSEKKPQTDLKVPKLHVEKPKTEKQQKVVDSDAEFLYNLSTKDGQYVGNGDEAKKLKRAFRKSRLEMASRVAEITNRRCFEGRMPMEVVTIEFTKRLLKTAGDTTTKGVPGARTCRVRLADKVCDTPGRLRDTLIHELCHAAVTMIDGVLHHRHGPMWVRWTNVVAKTFPKLPPITVCHRYAIQTKYVYVCLECGHQYGRHSKSIDVNTQRCGHCRGHLKLQEPQNSGVGDMVAKAMATPQSERPKNAWTTFVSANFASVKREMPPKSAHKDVMARLKTLYRSKQHDGDDSQPAPPPVTPINGIPSRSSTAEIDEQIDLILASSFNFNLNL